jgi:hypothetical protein
MGVEVQVIDGPSLGVGEILGDRGKKAGAFLVFDVIEMRFKVGWFGGYTVIQNH